MILGGHSGPGGSAGSRLAAGTLVLGVLVGVLVGGLAGGLPGLAGLQPGSLEAGAPESVRGVFLDGGHLFRDGPPARVTGGFGEDSCYACHWNGPENDGVGTLEIGGLPEVWEPGREYELEVTLFRPGMVVGGFQLATRFAADEEQAGTLAPAGGEDQRVGVLEDGGVQFAHHLLAGIELTGEDTVRWTMVWTAPSEAGGSVVIHLSSVAGDGDESQIGDHVYTAELEIAGPEG